MKVINLRTIIHAPVHVCFDLSRNIDLHIESMAETGEKAIAGCAQGLIELGQSVTWRAKHFGIYFKMTNRITVMEKPAFFIDEMVKGPFSSLKHEHHFESIASGTIMTDIFEFKAPFGIIGNVAETLFLERYLKDLLLKRNELIKTNAEKNKTLDRSGV